jgi:hypothetical protein
MNMLDMHTREKVNKIHTAEMHDEARNRYFLRDLRSVEFTRIAKERIRLMLVLAVFLLMVGSLLLAAAANSQ